MAAHFTKAELAGQRVVARFYYGTYGGNNGGDISHLEQGEREVVHWTIQETVSPDNGTSFSRS